MTTDRDVTEQLESLTRAENSRSIPYNPFVKKGWGRIYVSCGQHVKIVEKAIQKVDAFEWDYYPKDLIAVFDGKVKLIYTYKFEIDIDTLTELCWSKGIWIWCISQRNEDWQGWEEAGS